MAHRQEEKEKRRQERLAREEAERKAAARRKRLQYVFGGLLAVAAVAGIVAVLALGVLGGDDGGNGNPKSAGDVSSSVKLPEQKTGDLKAAAKAAGCELSNPPIEGSTHEDKSFKASDYKTNPPTSGNHNPDWYQDGIYNPGDTPKLGMLVHTLEHGRIDVQYNEGTSADDVAKLEALLGETDGYHMLLFQNTTGMDGQVAATAWGHSVTCPEINDSTWDALRTFRTSYIDKGPEAVP
ncbi:MAG TPA: DUF3105 domain-containing protein [Solirubrobacteraceae bacterium]|nr:DUF3105 domain-containing protein [Solirubrobacteraceae bacterium]